MRISDAPIPIRWFRLVLGLGGLGLGGVFLTHSLFSLSTGSGDYKDDMVFGLVAGTVGLAFLLHYATHNHQGLTRRRHK